MKELYSINSIINKYNEYFSLDWIENLKWDSEDSSKDSYTEGKSKIEDFVYYVFIEISQSVLKGEFLCCSNNKLEDLCEICQDDNPIDAPNKLKQDLQYRFRQLNNELYDISTIYRLHIQTVEDKIQLSECNYMVNAVSRHSAEFSIELFQILHTIIEICFREYELSYDEGFIQFLILQKTELAKYKQKTTNEDIRNIIKVVLFKVDFILRKLSHLSPNNAIEYFLDFKKQTINADNSINTELELYSYFQYFIDPNTIPINIVSEWQLKCSRKEAELWHFVLLMRYYTKVTKSKTQVKNLLNRFIYFHNKLIQKNLCRFDGYALKTVKNYMYNSQFSMIVDDSTSTYQEVIGKLDEIIDLQNETQIHNFHPYQKAVSYLFVHIRNCIKEEDGLSLIKNKGTYMLKIIKKLEETYKWCKKNQFYPFQLRRKDCVIRIKEMNMILFSPSSFSRPIRYDQLSDTVATLKLDASAICNEIRLYEEHSKMIAIKKEVEKTKKSQIEILGIFTAIITFFIGCVTIFTNVEKSISITEKIEHISYLGVILLLFISTGYFFVTENLKQWKTWFFGSMTFVYIIILIKVFFVS